METETKTRVARTSIQSTVVGAVVGAVGVIDFGDHVYLLPLIGGVVAPLIGGWAAYIHSKIQPPSI